MRGNKDLSIDVDVNKVEFIILVGCINLISSSVTRQETI